MSMATASYLFPTPSAAMIRTGDFPSSSSICSAPMATAPFPSPFFSPTTTPMYAPTSAFPPPPFFFGASPHSPYPAYTPPPAPAYAPLPLFPYPPPAQAPPPESTAPPSPTPASVFHPAPAYNSSPTFPTTTSVSKMQPDPALLLALPDATSPVLREMEPVLDRPTLDYLHANIVDRTPKITSSGATASVGFGSSPSSSTTLSSIPTSKVTRGGAPADRTLTKLHAYEGSKSEENASATPRKVCTLQTEKSGSDILTHLAPQHKPQRHGAALTRRLLHDLSRRLDEHYAQSQHSLESLQGELSKLSTSISQFAVALGRQTIEASVVTGSFPAAASVQFRSPATTASRLSDTSAAATSSANSGSSPVGASSTVFVAPQVFGEIPTPIFLQETHGTAPGHHNPIQHSYGTERSYFALPENYPLERVVPEQMFAVYDESDGCSNEFVQVFSDTPEQQTYEVEQDEGSQVPQCFSKPAFSPERSTVGAYNLTNEQNPDNEHNIVCVNKALADAFSQDATDFTSMLVPCLFADRPIDCSVRNLKTDLHSLLEYVLCYRHGEPQQVWDPGASLPLMSSKAQRSSRALQPAIDATLFAGSSVIRFSGCKCLQFWVQNNTYVLWKSEIGMPTYISWDPGVLNILDLMLDKYTVPSNVQFMQRTTQFSCLSLAACTQYTTPNGHNFVLQDTSFIPQKSARFSQGNYFCSLYCSSLLKTEYCPWRCLWEFSVSCTKLIFKFGVPTHVPQQSCYCRVPSSQENHGMQFVWDPGSLSLMDVMVDKRVVPNLIHRSQKTFRLLYFIGQPVDLAKFWAQLLIQCHSRYNPPNTFLQGLQIHMIQLAECSANYECHLSSALLSPTHIVSYSSSNSKAGEPISRFGFPSATE